LKIVLSENNIKGVKRFTPVLCKVISRITRGLGGMISV